MKPDDYLKPEDEKDEGHIDPGSKNTGHLSSNILLASYKIAGWVEKSQMDDTSPIDSDLRVSTYSAN